MDKKPLIGVSICAVVLLVLASLSNVVGYQSVKSTNQQMIKEEINQKELLFQTIVDMANDKEIRDVIIESQGMTLFNPIVKTPLSLFPALTKKQLYFVYYLGMSLSKTICMTRMASLVKENLFSTTEIKEKINSILRNNVRLNKEVEQLSLLNCSCSESASIEPFPILCGVLFLLFAGTFSLAYFLANTANISDFLEFFGLIFITIAYLTYYIAEQIIGCRFPNLFFP
jgi:hypothetical protein